MIKMAKQVAGAGIAGRKASKAEAEGAVESAIGGLDREFTAKYGVNYWGYLKEIFNDYVASRGLGQELVVRGYPFNFMTVVDTKCSAVMLRKNYHKGEHLVEPELFLEVGVVRDGKGSVFTGVTFGCHYLYGADGNKSVFVQGVLGHPVIEQLVEKLRCSQIVEAAYFLQLDNDSVESRHADASKLADPQCRARDYLDTSLLFRVSLTEDEVGDDLRERVFGALDEVMPFFQALSALPAGDGRSEAKVKEPGTSETVPT